MSGFGQDSLEALSGGDLNKYSARNFKPEMKNEITSYRSHDDRNC